jgi:LPXTG-site transpeptidase (sortase) family protein
MGFEDDLPGDLPIGLEIAASPSPVNNCGGTLTAVAGTQLIKLEDGALGTNAACTLVIPVLGNIQGSYTNTIEAGKLTSNEGATNHDSTSDTLLVTGTAAGGSGSGGDDDQGVVVRGAGRGAASVPPALLPAVSGFLIPVTGFRPDAATSLNEATRPSYDALDLQIEIPVIDVNTSIMGVQIKDGNWDISWLQGQVGWLNGTAYPTWNGNSVLTGHVVDADGQPGVFSRLKQVGVGEYVYIYINGYRYTYQVISNQSVDPSDVSVFRHEKEEYLTLITCDVYDENSDSYLLRIAVRSKLVDIRPAQ